VPGKEPRVCHYQRVSGLRELWRDTIPDAGALADELVTRYGARRRTAYRERYLTRVLEAFEALEQLCTDPVAVRLAIWFHRAVHADTNTARDDAEASAQLAEELLPTCGVKEVRTAEVAQLIRQTSEGANADVFLDAVNAVLADRQYSTFASEVRRHSRFDATARREQIQAMLASERIYRTELAHERYEQAARANLTSELELLDALTPNVWRGWQHSGLSWVAILTAATAFTGGSASIHQPWRYPKLEDVSPWPAVLMIVLVAVSLAAVLWAVRRTDRAGRIVAAVPSLIGLIALVVMLLNVPPSTAGSGAGPRVPFLLITSVMLVVSGVAAFAATWFRRAPTRNRGQVLGGLGGAVVVFLVAVFALDPIQNAYLFSADEYVENNHQPADLNAASVVDGNVLWTSRGDWFESSSVVATAGGIALARGRSAVEMIDPGTGKTRWRYIRAGTDQQPHLYALNGGRQLLVSYDYVGYLVLDADTGRRTATWPDGDLEYDVEDNDPLVTGESVSKGSDKLYGTNVDGSDRWKYEPGRCVTISATAAAETAVAELQRSCGETSQLVGLDLKTGKQRWSRDGSFDTLTAAGDLMVGVQKLPGIGRKLTAFDPRTGAEKWTAEIPVEWGCSLGITWTGRRIVLVDCPSAQAETETVVRFLDPATGRTTATVNADVPWQARVAVTADGRVFAMGWHSARGCWIVKLTEGAAPEHFDLGTNVRCDGAFAAGNLVLVARRDSLIALR
jgi:predicted metal-dependent HD superfamily phosphohydrolase/outer membrane protein assembly factor BamB